MQCISASTVPVLSCSVSQVSVRFTTVHMLTVFLFLYTSYMYWTMWGDEPQLVRSNLDGTQRKVLIPDLGRVQDLTIDYIDRRLYWTDIDQRNIQSSTLLG